MSDERRGKTWKVQAPVVALDGACIVRVRNRWYNGTVRRVQFIMTGARRGYWQYGVQRDGRRQWNWVGNADIRSRSASSPLAPTQEGAT